MPRTADVVVSAPGLPTPRTVMHRCSASMTTSAPASVEPLHQLVGDLHGHPLLHLEPLGVPVDEAGQLGEPAHAPRVARYVDDVGFADERQEVVLAKRRERDVADHHHLVVVDLELPVEVVARILVVADQQFAERAGDAGRRLGQSIAVRDPRRSR